MDAFANPEKVPLDWNLFWCLSQASWFVTPSPGGTVAFRFLYDTRSHKEPILEFQKFENRRPPTPTCALEALCIARRQLALSLHQIWGLKLLHLNAEPSASVCQATRDVYYQLSRCHSSPRMLSSARRRMLRKWGQCSECTETSSRPLLQRALA